MILTNENYLQVGAQGFGDQLRVLHRIVSFKIEHFSNQTVTIEEIIPNIDNTGRHTKYKQIDYESKRDGIIYPRHKLSRDFNIQFVIQDLYKHKSIYINSESIEFKSLKKLKGRKTPFTLNNVSAYDTYQLFDSTGYNDITVVDWENERNKNKPISLFDILNDTIDFSYLKRYFKKKFTCFSADNFIDWNCKDINYVFSSVQNSKLIIAPEGGISHLSILTNKPLLLVLPNKLLYAFPNDPYFLRNKLIVEWVASYFRLFFTYHYHHNKLFVVFEDELYEFYDDVINAVTCHNRITFSQPKLINTQSNSQYHYFFNDILNYSLKLQRFKDK